MSGDRAAMLHISHTRVWDIAASPFGQEIDRLGVPHRYLVGPVNLRYRHRAALLLRIYPQLIARAIQLAVRSMRSLPRPTAVVVSTDVEAVVFGAIRRLFRRRTVVVMQTVIVTPRRSPLQNRLYMAYWRLIMASIDLAICHARSEVESYARLFPRHAHKLVFIPFGTTIHGREALRAGPMHEVPLIVTAGRSGRDYRTLAQAIEGLPCRLAIICDAAAPLADVPPSQQITVLRECFDDTYIKTLASADIVVVPLAVDDISAGQMVLLQAAALARPVVITRTATTVEYAADNEDALLVERHDTASMRAALLRLLNDPALRARLGAAAAARFDRDHSTEAFVRHLVAAIAATPAHQA